LGSPSSQQKMNRPVVRVHGFLSRHADSTTHSSHLLVINIFLDTAFLMDASRKLEPLYRKLGINSQAVKSKAEEHVRLLDSRAPTGIAGNVPHNTNRIFATESI
jgi:hypothetical protein